LAFLPQFVDPSASFAIWMQLVILGTGVNLMFSSADFLCILLAGAVVARFRRSGRARLVMQRTGGAVLVGLGAHLALQKS
jgi:threonine/homoserine/homoserine lactone efflux protein